jgi:hypothetical protein
MVVLCVILLGSRLLNYVKPNVDIRVRAEIFSALTVK